MLNVNLLNSMARVGRRLAEAGREARAASTSVAGAAADQVTEVIGAAVGEVVRAAVIGAVAAAVRGATPHVPRTVALTDHDAWDDESLADDESGDRNGTNGAAVIDTNTPPSVRPRWVTATRAMGSALSVAAGAAAAVPGGRMVAAGLGGLAAVAGLAARAAEPTA